MIERAFEEVLGIGTRSIENYVRDDRYKLIKVHGSVNWARRISEPADRANEANALRVLIADAARLKFAEEWSTVDRYPLTSFVTRDGEHRGGVPAIALPLRTKSAFECPPYHLKALEDSLPHVTKVLIVGWQAWRATTFSRQSRVTLPS